MDPLRAGHACELPEDKGLVRLAPGLQIQNGQPSEEEETTHAYVNNKQGEKAQLPPPPLPLQPQGQACGGSLGLHTALVWERPPGKMSKGQRFHNDGWWALTLGFKFLTKWRNAYFVR